MPNGQHLIAGEWIAGETTFRSSPATGEPGVFAEATPAHVDRAVQAAEAAFESYGYAEAKTCAALLDRIADELEARGEALTEIAGRETALPAARLETERGRTTGQLRMFARLVERGDHLDRRHDAALPDRKPLPRPELRLMQRPIGPVAVFGASNFPLAFSTLGGDTASALAAGCPVIYKSHPAHPGAGELAAEAAEAAIRAVGVDPGVFSLLQGSTHDLGRALVEHPLIRAVGFTGSFGGGKALFDLCARRPEPIPFYGELGSINPMFVLPEALAARGAAVGEGWAASLTMGVGQFCTNPGVAVLVEGAEADAFEAATKDKLAAVAAQTMLTDGIAEAFRRGRDRMAETGSAALFSGECEAREAAPALFTVTAERWLADESLAEEVFGPLGVLVRARDEAEMLAVARGLRGQLTCTLHMDAGDRDLAARLLPTLERKAGRLLANGFPTGVEVADAMVHGGPYPATTNFGHTSVGTLSIRRWLRPVCWQNMPEALLPEALRGA